MIDFSHSGSEPSTHRPATMISVEKVGLVFRKHTSFLGFLFGRANPRKEFWALEDVTFSLSEGETIGIIGRNGSGKSTLSLVCAGIYAPDRGSIRINGKVQLLTLGVGFQNDLTGRENVYISGSLLGLTPAQIRGRMDEIEDFADINHFMDEPVRTYSSGMRSRLAFSIATAIRPDILILDEVLTTGDSSFRDKAMERIKNLHALTKSAVIVSHNSNQVKELCHRVVWLEKGRIIMQGQAIEVVEAYQTFCRNPAQWLEGRQSKDPEGAPR
jgi:ABC-type polysaccharide/polyol phosphate transport system ATPase subunit